jgi:site-specific DNA recombinase
MSKTVAYIRVSTTKQLEGAGPAQQRDSIIAYAMSKGLQVDEWYTDDETGTTEDREQIQALLKQAQEGKLGRLIVDRMDRLGRHMHVCEGLYEAFKKAGCQVVLTNINLEDETPENVMMRQMLGIMAQYQRSALIRHMGQCAKAKARRTGAHANCQTPFGYSFDRGGGRMVINEEEANAVRRIFELHWAGRSLRQVMKVLHDEGWRVRKGDYWHPPQVARIIRREAQYAAQAPFVEGGTIVQQPIIDIEKKFNAIN